MIDLLFKCESRWNHEVMGSCRDCGFSQLKMICSLYIQVRPITENSYPQILKTSSDNPIFDHHELIPWCSLSAVTFIFTQSVLTAASLTGLSVRGVWRLPCFLVFRVLCFLHPLSRSCSTL